MKNYIIILAAGVGNRLKDKLPKQFLLLGDKPVLMHTITTFYNSGIEPAITVVLHKDYINYWHQLCKQYDFYVPHQIAEGGVERFYSVKNALALLPDEGIVGVHDGVRPFVTEKVICDAFVTAKALSNASPAVSATNTIRFFDGNSPNKAVNRNHIYVVQNPQVFALRQIKEAYRQEYNPLFTDDATVAEHYGMEINLVEGDQRNIKITHPCDMAIAEGILRYNFQHDKQIDPIRKELQNENI